tara:strand:+ start:449 stop:715 length:267 start_codon:yes stop_codon:yes gene_type:complete
MSTTITVTLTDTQQKAMDYWMTNTQDFVVNFTHETARRARDEIVAVLVAHCNANTIQIATGIDAQVDQAYTLNLVKTHEERAAENTPE